MKHPIYFLSLTVLFTLISISSNGQTNFRPGYYINYNLDTIFGQIDYRSELRNGKICLFRTGPESEEVRFEPGDIRSYRFDPGKYYITKWVETDGQERFVFAEYLVNGIADLYYYRNEQTDHYFIETEDGRLVELNNEEIIVRRDGRTHTTSTNRHIGLLKATFSDCPEIQTNLESAQLSHKSLINLTSDYHHYVCNGEQCIIYEKDIPAVRLTFAPVAGAGLSSLSFSESNLLGRPSAFKSSPSPFVGVQLQASLPRINEKFSVQLETGVARNNYATQTTTEEYWRIISYDASINANSWQSSLALKYTFPKGGFRPTIAAGGQSAFYFNQESGYTKTVDDNGTVTIEEEDYMPVATPQWGAMVQLGLDYHLLKNIVFFTNFRYQYSKGIDFDFQATTAIHSLSLVLGTYF
ncbi:MAG: outer membrane beta-barrel protein [Bacteroidota bacterium]